MRKVLIIGGNCDIGRALSKYFLDNGDNVFVGYHKNDNNDNKNIKYFKCDVCDIKSVDSCIGTIVNQYGKLDIVINLACLCMDNAFLNKTKNEFMKELEVNLVGTFICNQVYSKYVDDGLIVNVASTDGVDTYNEYNIGYSASKAGIINMSKSIAMSTNNKIVCLCPNWIETNSTIDMDNTYLTNELKRIGQNRLITLDEFVFAFDQIISGSFNSGEVFRIDIKGDKVWVEKI